MSLFQEIKQKIIAAHNIVVDPIKVDIMLLYYGAIALNGTNIKLKDYETDTVRHPVFYGMIFAPSSSGKDFLKTSTSTFFRPVMEAITRGINKSKANNFTSGVPVLEQYQNKVIQDLETSVSGSNIGLYMLGYIINYSGLGSLNISINEFADILGKTSNLSMLKELYDGTLMANIIQGEKDEDIRPNIYDLPTNMIAYGTLSSVKNDTSMMRMFKNIAETGLYRRSIIYSEEIKPMVRKKPKALEPGEIPQYFVDLYYGFGVDRKKGCLRPPTVLEFSSEAKHRLTKFSEDMFDYVNENLYDDLIPLDRNVDKMIQYIACIYHWLDYQQDKLIEQKYVEKAINLFMESRKTVQNLFVSIPIFEQIFDYLKYRKKKTSESEIIKALGISVRDMKDAIPYVEEWAIRQGRRVVITGNKLKMYDIEEFEKNDLQSIVVSIPHPSERKYDFTAHFVPKNIPFMDSDFSLLRLLKNDKGIKSFALAHYAPTTKKPMGHRDEKSFIPGQNAIAFDFDGEITIDSAKKIFQPYTYILYTTKSHSEQEHRFRVVMPTATKYYVTPDEHKMMYKNIVEMLNIPYNDAATYNVSRSWAINPNCELFLNQGELIDVLWAIENSQHAEESREKFENIDVENLDRRVFGMMKYVIANAKKGNRNIMLYRLAKFCVDLGLDPSGYVVKVNTQLSEGPLPESEVREILKSAASKGR